MIKSLLIKLRRKPKVVREHVALGAAGVFTFIVFAAWALTLPGKFSDVPSQSAGIFSTLKDELAKEAPNLGEIATDIKEVVATTSDQLQDENNEIIFEDSTVEIDLEPNLPDPTAKPVRLATTSHATSSLEGQNMLE